MPDAVRDEVAFALVLIAQELIEHPAAREWIDSRDRLSYDSHFAEQLKASPELTPRYAAIKKGA